MLRSNSRSLGNHVVSPEEEEEEGQQWEGLAACSYFFTVLLCCANSHTYYYRYSITHSFIPGLEPSFCPNPSHRSLSFSSSGFTTWILQTVY